MTTSSAPKSRPDQDQLDPELVALRRPIGGLGPLLAGSVLVLAGHLMVLLWPDLRFALRAGGPRDLGDVSVSWRRADAPTPTDNIHVALRASLDHAGALRLRGRQDTGHRLVPVAGTSRRLWLSQEGEAANVPAAYDDRHVGRLRRLDDLPYADEVRLHLAGAQLAPRFVFPEALSGGLPSRDAAGDLLEPPPDSPVEVDERIGDRARFTVVQSDSLPDEAAAGAFLVARGILPAAAKPVATTARPGGRSWTYEVPAPGGLDPLKEHLRDAGLAATATSAVPVIERRRATFRELVLRPDALVLSGRVVPMTAVERVIFYTAAAAPAVDAFVLLEGESPATLWYVPWLYAGLAVVAALMVWSLMRRWRAYKVASKR